MTAGAIRAIDLPRLVGPALLTLVFYLWDALHGSAPARRREPRFLWEVLLLAALGVVVVLWNLRSAGAATGRRRPAFDAPGVGC